MADASGTVKTSLEGFEEKLSIWAAPPRPSKFDEKTGLTIWKNLRWR